MTREQLIKAIFKDSEAWSCPSPCPHSMEEMKKGACLRCCEKQLEKYEMQIRTEVIKPIQKFIEGYDGAIIISDILGVVSGQQIINELKQVLEQLKKEK